MITRVNAKFPKSVYGICILIFFLFITALSNAQPNGEALFKANCTQCHAVNSQVIGPALQGIEQRRDEAWILKWVKNSQSVIKSGDPYAVDLFKKFNNVVMPNQNVNDDEIKAILTYVKNFKAPVSKVPTATPGAPTEEPGFNWTLFIIVCILLALSLTLGKVKRGLERAVREKEGIPHPPVYTWKVSSKIWIRGHKKLIAVALVVFACWSSWEGWYALAGIGITQDYQPDQPIKFSHKLHAGDNKINCIYCHSGAEKSRHANIPSANVCMNCHKYIKEGPNYGEDEIKKIYAALDWDGTKYGTNQKPLQWVRVHNLPDFAYFNHSQHVKVGKIQCQTCHGPIQEMEQVKQFSPLTMGWCINCHRETEVKMDSNGYYTALHEKLKAQYGPEAKMTVDKIGGLECARCHY